jgi:hypothetical protein
MPSVFPTPVLSGSGSKSVLSGTDFAPPPTETFAIYEFFADLFFGYRDVFNNQSANLFSLAILKAHIFIVGLASG